MDVNCETFAQSVVSNYRGAAQANDFDLEYLGATDIPGILLEAPDSPSYLGFLQISRSLLPSGKTISMTAPALYWYLKGFPIVNISKVLDYIVCMTYDLHG